jgi:hypothetical protein
VGATSLAVYLRTLAPGLVPILDTPVFQFVGRVLGVPHNPGYPFYVLVTHAWSWLPFGTLAFRMNLFSAVMGAIAAALVYLLARAVGCGRVTAAGGALGLAFGRVFWSQAVIAEVYTLNAVLVAAMLLAMCRWADRRRTADFRLAVACLAAGLGNHTTIVLFVPGLVAFALLTDARVATRARQVAWVLLMAAASIAQYAFIIVRTRTPGAYVESPARTAGELVGVIRGQQFASGLFAFSWPAVLHDRLPTVAGIVVHELTVAGVALAAVGVAVCIRRRPHAAVLLATGAALTFAFAVNYDAVDIYVFLIPVFLVLWIFVAAGSSALAGALTSRARPAAAAALLIVPVALLARNFTANDLSHDTATAIYFRQLVEGLPRNASIVHEDFLIDRMVMYEVLGERVAPAGLRLVAQDPAAVGERLRSGAPVFAFPVAADRLRAAGLDVDFAWRRVLGPPLPEYLRSLPRGTRFAFAVPGSQSAAYRDALNAPIDEEGLAVVDASAGAARDRAAGPPLASGTIRVGTAHGPEPLPVMAEGGRRLARVLASGRPLAESMEGAALVTWAADGSATAVVARAADGFRVPIVQRAFALSQVSPGPAAPDPLSGLLRPLDAHTAWITMSRDEQSQLAVSGWGEVDADATGPFRFVASSPARLHIPASPPIDRISVTLRATDAGPHVITATLGTSVVGTAVAGGSGWRSWEWRVPAGASGDLQLTFEPSAGGRVAVGDVVLHYRQEP